MAAKKTAWNAGVFVDSPLSAADTTTSISVVNSSDAAVATIYSDRDGAAKTNPFNIATTGQIELYADPGRYDITATRGADTVTWSDVLIRSQAIVPEEKTASFTLGEFDLNKMFVITGSGTVNVTIPPVSTIDLEAGFIAHIRHDGTGTLTIVEGSGVTAQPPNNGTLVIPADGTVSIYYPSITSNRWVVFGQVTDI